MIRTKVMRSAAGWYIGQEQWDEESQCWFPYDRLSDYYYSKWEAVLDFDPKTFNFEEALREIEEELPRLRKNKHPLAKSRTKFLLQCKLTLSEGRLLVYRWNYSVFATPETAIQER